MDSGCLLAAWNWGREVYWWFLGLFAAGIVNAYKPIVDLVQHDKPACFSSDSMAGLSPHTGVFPSQSCSMAAMQPGVLECQPGIPSLDRFKLLDVFLEVWVPDTGCTLQDGSDHGGVGSSSESDVAVTKVPSEKNKLFSFPFSALMETCLDHVTLLGSIHVQVTLRYLLSSVVPTASLCSTYMF